MNQSSTTDTLLAFAIVFACGMVSAHLMKCYCGNNRPPPPRNPPSQP